MSYSRSYPHSATESNDVGIKKSPLRYPGGKSCLAGYFEMLLAENGLSDGHYAEVYCGGAGVAIELLLREVVRVIHINDADNAIAAFWRAVVHHTDELCDRIVGTKLSMKEYDRQKAIMLTRRSRKFSDLALGFATFFLNRLNRSGILNGGVIGGRAQEGPWKMDARYNAPQLAERVQRIGAYGDRIRVYELDALDFLEAIAAKVERRGLIYLDPPYFEKGRYLYMNHYKPQDHADVARKVRSLSSNWVVTYDCAPEIEKLYTGYKRIEYSLSYSARNYSRGSEIMFLSKRMKLPTVNSPVSVGSSSPPRSASFSQR